MELVRWIFDQYLNGRSTAWIADKLTELRVASPTGHPAWHRRSICYILTNEKYIGDSLGQKNYTTSTFPFDRRRNKGEMVQYYTEHSHPAIIDQNSFKKVQALIQRRAEKVLYPFIQYPLAKKIFCGECGTLFLRKASKNGYIAWVCRKHDDRAADCPVGRIAETEIYAAFVRMYNKLKQHEGIILKRCKNPVTYLGGDNAVALILSTTNLSKHLLATGRIPIFPIQVCIYTAFIHIRNLCRRYILDLFLIRRYFLSILLLVAGRLFFLVILCRRNASRMPLALHPNASAISDWYASGC